MIKMILNQISLKNFKRAIVKLKSLLKDGFGHIFVGTFLNKVVAMVSSIVIARLVDKNSYAYLSYSDTIYGYLSLFAGLGFATAILKMCSGDTDRAKDMGYVKYAVKYGSLFQILTTVAVLIVSVSITLPFPEAKKYILVSAFYPLIHYIYDLATSYIRTKQRNKLYAWLHFLYSLLICILGIGLVYAFDAIGIVYARYLVLLIVGSISVVVVWKLLQNKGDVSLDKASKKEFLSMALILMLANAFSGMMPFNEHIMISNIIADEVTTANFKVAGLFPQMLLLVTQAVNIYFFPIIAGLDNKGKNARRKIIKVGVFNFMLVSVAITVGIILTPWLISFFYGEKYVDAIPIAYLLWIMRGINAGIRMVPMNMLVAIRKIKFNLYMSIVSVVIQIGLNWVFITNYGVKGVAYGTIGVYLITGVIYWIYFLKSTKVKKPENKD